MSDYPPIPPESYSPEDLQQILYLAIARQGNQEELSREQLWEIADELDIDKNTLQAAEREWLQEKAITKKRQAFNLYRRNKLKQKTAKYLILNTFLISFNLIVAGAITWSLYIVLIWGLALALSAWKTFQSEGEEYERAFQRWDFQNQVKQTVTTFWDKLQKAWQA
ncbi:MAG: 2TM domain-containing protein [Xenococcaceae cyanobacterium MO_188.B29]|nr:2TM domain-containing protein [Xenococcaceae cyanobacterium MO_188.B29]